MEREKGETRMNKTRNEKNWNDGLASKNPCKQRAYNIEDNQKVLMIGQNQPEHKLVCAASLERKVRER
jgi:hypothetical protein